MSASSRDVAYAASAAAGVLALIALAWLRASDPFRAHDRPLGPYADASSYCGKAGVAQDVTTIPWAGCFRLHAGRSAEGTFAGQRVSIQIDASGEEHFFANGRAVVDRMRRPERTASETNLPLVRLNGSGYAFCRGDEPANFCPFNIAVWSRAPDRSVTFTAAERIPPTYRVCVLTLENWRYEVSRRRGAAPRS